MQLHQILEELILMREVLKDLRYHKRMGKKLAVAGDIGRIKYSFTKLVEMKKYPKDAENLIEVVEELEAAINDDKYLIARKKLEVTIRSVARLVADTELDKWRAGK